jgi:Mg2+/Co2+ transporter CorB
MSIMTYIFIITLISLLLAVIRTAVAVTMYFMKKNGNHNKYILSKDEIKLIVKELNKYGKRSRPVQKTKN